MNNIREAFTRRRKVQQRGHTPTIAEYESSSPHVENFFDLDPSTQPSFNHHCSIISLPSTLSSLHNATPTSTIQTLTSLLQSPLIQIDPYQRLILDIVLQTVTEDIERTIRLDKENKRFREKIKELKTGLDKEESKRRAFEMLYEKKKSELIVARGIMKTIEQAILGVGIEEARMGE
jgi:hypothetical protein